MAMKDKLGENQKWNFAGWWSLSNCHFHNFKPIYKGETIFTHIFIDKVFYYLYQFIYLPIN